LQSPVWSNDGQYIAYASRTGGIWWSRDGASGVLMKGRKDQEILVPTSISPDGKWLAYHARGLERQSFDIWVAPIHPGPGGPETGTPMLYRGTEAFETYPVFSPDGRWIAYASNESGQWEIYVRAFPDDGRVLMVSASGGRTPIWDWRSGTLYYMNEDRRLIAADLSARGGQLAVHSLRPAGTAQLADTGVIAGYDAVNGKILGLLPAEDGARSDLVLLTDFRSKLASPAPTRAP
jgi:serine/threonine-protein kinase